MGRNWSRRPKGVAPCLLLLCRNDITKMAVDAVVNAANTALKMGGGVCGGHLPGGGRRGAAAGMRRPGRLRDGPGRHYQGFPAPGPVHHPHPPGPRWRGGGQGEEQLLRQCYINSLKLAAAPVQFGGLSLISAGVYGFPKDKALQCAVSAITEYLAGAEDDMEVCLVIRDREEFRPSRDALRRVEDYIARHLAEEPPPALPESGRVSGTTGSPRPYRPPGHKGRNLCPGPLSPHRRQGHDRRGGLQAGQHRPQALFQNSLQPRLYAQQKDGGGPGHCPAARPPETEDLLNRAGYALSRSQLFDLIIRYHIENGIYNIWEINQLAL